MDKHTNSPSAKEVLQGIQREINFLSDGNRSTKKRALEKILRDVVNNLNITRPVLNDVFKEICKPLLKMLGDPADKCRELTIEIIKRFYSSVDQPHLHLPYIIPHMGQRLGVNEKDIVEPTEEIRLQLMELLLLICETSGKLLDVYIDELILILQKTLIDPYPDVRRTSCTVTDNIAASMKEKFYLQGESLINSLLISLSHQHYKVRVAALQTIGVTVQETSGKCVDDVISHLAQRTFDHSAPVRMMVTTVIGDWLLNLRDRYSFFHKLIPLLLTGLSDEMPEIRDKSEILFNKAGELYEVENEKDFKEKQDFHIVKQFEPMLEHHRPGIGCRALVQRNFSKILPALLRDATDWNPQTRIKAMSLLTHLIFYAEDFVTMHMETLLQGLYKASQDDEPEVAAKVKSSALYAGLFVEPSVFCKLVMAQLRLVSNSSPQACAATVKVLSFLLEKCNPHLLQTELQVLLGAVSSPDVCATISDDCQQQLISLVAVLVKKPYIDISPFGYDMFFILMTLAALSEDTQIPEKISDVLHGLAICLNLSPVPGLIRLYGLQMLKGLSDTVLCWSGECYERKLFGVLLLNAREALPLLLPLSVDLLANALEKSRDPELRLGVLSMITRLMVEGSEINTDLPQHLKKFSSKLITESLIPNCTWEAGRKAAALRACAISCIWSIIKTESIEWRDLESILHDLHKQVIPCLEDASQTTRLVTCQLVLKLLVVYGSSFSLEMLHLSYPEFLKRLDDSSDEVRIITCKVLASYFKSLPKDYDLQFYRLHLEEMFKCLLLHLDDPSTVIQEDVLLALKAGAVVHGGLLGALLEEVRHKHRTQTYCDKLANHIAAMK